MSAKLNQIRDQALAIVFTEFEEEKLKLMDKFIEDNRTKFSSNDLLFSSKLKK